MRPPHTDILRRNHLRFSAALVTCSGAALLLGAGSTEARLSVASKNPVVSLSGPHNYRVGGHPMSVAVADLNGDRRLDLAVATGRNTLSVLLNRGHGRFPAKRAYQVGLLPTGVAIRDFNGDRKPDLVVANSGDSTVSVLLNKGGARFGRRHDYPTGVDPFGVAVGDLNGDHRADVATTNLGDEDPGDPKPTVSFLPGSGDGGLGEHIDYALSAESLSLAIRDLNGDARADLVAAHAPKVSVFLNSSHGLEAPRDYRSYGDWIAIADMNGDRKPDLVGSGSSAISVLLNQGAGTFGRLRAYDIGYSQGIAVVDLNQDHRPDVVTGEPISPNQEDCDTEDGGAVEVLANKGSGKLSRPLEFSTGYYGCDPLSLALADVTGEGTPDLVTANNFSGTVSILVNAFGRCAVPDFEDGAVWTLTVATRILRRAGCRVGAVSYAYSKRVPRGAVISQRPDWGAVLRKGGRVNLVISKGQR